MPAVQTSGLGVGGYPSAAVSFSSTPTVGNYVLVVGVFNPTFGTPPTGVTITDNQTGNTYTATVYADASNGAGCFIGRAEIVGASGTFTVTATVTGGAADAGVAVAIQEWDDLGTLDRSGTASVIFGTGSDFLVTASAANSGADRIVVAVLSGRNSQDLSSVGSNPPSTGYSNIFSRLTGSFGEPRGIASVKTVSSVETSSADWNEVTGPGGSGPMLIATFEVIAGAVTHDATGALANAGATTVGSASRIGPFIPPWAGFYLRSGGRDILRMATKVPQSPAALSIGETSIFGEAGAVSHDATGALANAGAATSGSAERIAGGVTHDATGALANAGATSSGSATRFRAFASSGVLANPGAATSGTAARTRDHAATGTLANPGGTTSGAASSATERSASGVLAGAGGTLSGLAERIAPGGTHDATGALSNPGGATVGSAARLRAFASSGALVNLGAVTVGAATRTAAPVSHDATGTLANPGAVLVGFATNESGVVTDTHDGFWAREYRKMWERKPKVAEVVELVKDEPIQALEVVREVVEQKYDLGQNNAEATKIILQSVQLQRFIAQQLIAAAERKAREDEEMDIEDILMML